MPKNNKVIKNVQVHMYLTDEHLLTIMIQAKCRHMQQNKVEAK